MKSKVGFTLIETLVALAILAVLIALTLAGVQRVRASATRVDCANRMRQLAMACQNYHNVRQRLPEGCGYPYLRSEENLKSHCGVSWLTDLLPYVEQDALGRRAWAAYAAAPNGDSDEHIAIQQEVVKAFRCPADGRGIGVGPVDGGEIRWGLTNYLGVAGTGVLYNDGLFHRHFLVTLGGITDGTSNTLLIGERPSGPNGIWSAWYANWGRLLCIRNSLLPVRPGDWFPDGASGCAIRPTVFYQGEYDNACDLNHFWSQHPGGANFAFADGSVHFLRYSADSVLPALATRAGGETVVVPD